MRVILVRRCFLVGVMSALLFGVGNVQAQRGAKVPPEHANQEPINHLPNPYETVRDFGTLPDGRTWGSVSALNVDIDGVHIWVADRCGSNSCAESNVDPIVKMDPEGNVVKSFGAGLITWPHGMDVDSEGNVWIVDARFGPLIVDLGISGWHERIRKGRKSTHGPDMAVMTRSLTHQIEM